MKLNNSQFLILLHRTLIILYNLYESIARSGNFHLKKGRMLTLVGLLKVLHVSASFLNNIFSALKKY